MNSKVTDQGVLKKCREMLDAWSASRPYSPTKKLGSESELVGAVSHTVERFTLTTGLRMRKAMRKKLKNGSSYNRDPRPISSYDIWDDVNPEDKRSEFEVGLKDTTFAETCSDCQGNGKIACQKCNGEGRWICTKSHHNFKSDENIMCYNMVEDGLIPSFGAKHYMGKSWHKCDCDPRTHVMVCPECKGSGHVVCKTCGGTGCLVYEWFVSQKCKETKGERVWTPCDRLSDAFYGLDRLTWNSLFDDEVEDERFTEDHSRSLVSAATLAVMQDVGLEAAWSERIAVVDKEIEAFEKTDEEAECRTGFEHALFEQYDGIVEYDYTYDGRQYKAWINLATGAVEETEDGLYGSVSKETVELAQNAERTGDPQNAIYYYCKADAVSLKWSKENGTQKKRVKQYLSLGLFFGLGALVASVVSWLPFLCMSGMNAFGIVVVIAALALITVCMVSINEAFQVVGLLIPFGIGYLARSGFGDGFGSDMVSREGLILSLLLYAIGVVTLTTDPGQRLPRGKAGLVAGGAVCGLVGLPVAFATGLFTQSFVSVGGAFASLVGLAVFSLTRLPVRLRAGKIQKFVEKNDGKGEKIRRVIEGRKPGAKGVKVFACFVGVVAVCSLLTVFVGPMVDELAGNVHFAILTSLQNWGIL